MSRENALSSDGAKIFYINSKYKLDSTIIILYIFLVLIILLIRSICWFYW